METAEEFALSIAEECHYGVDFDLAECTALISQDRAAVALAAKRELLEELISLVNSRNLADPHARLESYRAAYSELKNKYAAKAGGDKS